MPRPIDVQWRPRESVYDVLQMANISRQFAEQLPPEFILYWQENGTPQCSWAQISSICKTPVGATYSNPVNGY